MKNPKNGQFMSSRSLMIALSLFGLFLLTAGGSWAVFTFLRQEPNVTYSNGDLADTRSKIESLPKTEECPTNGKLYTDLERDIWETRRPIAAMIENHADSRPLEGLHKADIVYEAVAEGGITRQLAIFYCGASAEDVRIAPVRSARVYFITWAAEYGDFPIFTHVGGANSICSTCPGGVKPRNQVAKQVDAYQLLSDLGWRVPKGNDFDTIFDVGFPVLFKDPERLGRPVASEHTMVSMTDAIYDEAGKRGFTFKDNDGNAWDENYRAWKFVDESASSSPKATDISFEFWSDAPDYDVEWKYDSSSNLYKRINGGKEAKDLSSNQQFVAKNVVVQFVDESGPVDSEKHMFYKTIGEGDALVFQNGNVIKATWEKDAIDSRTIFKDENGKEIEFVRGEVWVEAVPTGNEINY